MIIISTLSCGCEFELPVAFDEKYLFQLPIRITKPCKQHKEKPLIPVFDISRMLFRPLEYWSWKDDPELKDTVERIREYEGWR